MTTPAVQDGWSRHPSVVQEIVSNHPPANRMRLKRNSSNDISEIAINSKLSGMIKLMPTTDYQS